jgi:hypothetical protein
LDISPGYDAQVTAEVGLRNALIPLPLAQIMKKNLLALGPVWLWPLMLPCATFAQPLYQDLGVNFSVTGWTNNQAQLLLSCESGVTYAIESSTDLQNWTWMLANSDSNILRSFMIAAPSSAAYFRVGRIHLPVFQAALAASGTIDFRGNNVTTDSFDSADPNYSAFTIDGWGLYDPAKDKASGDVITDSATPNSINVSNALIRGTIRTAPAGQAAIGPDGSVGDLAWVNGGNLGVEAGHYRNDMNVNWPDVALPSVPWVTPAPANTYINGVFYKYYLTEGNYQISDFIGSTYVASGLVNIYVPPTGRIHQTGEDVIYVAPPGPPGPYWDTRLHLYAGVNSAVLAGNGVTNAGDAAVNFIYFGLLTNTNFIFAANANFTGCLYCPEAALSLTSASTNTYDFAGACIGKSITVKSNLNFHFDENLQRIGPGR